MKRIGFVLAFIIWIVSLFFYFLLLLCIIGSVYPEVSLEPYQLLSNSFIHFASILFMLINFGMVFIGIKNGVIKKRKLKLSLFFIPIFFYLISLLSPFYLVYFSNVQNLEIRADQRAYEGNWEQAINIYSFIKPRIKGANPNVSRIQSWLKKAGYYENEIDGRVNDKILEQLHSFQRDNNLEPDGFIGEATQFVLFNKIFKKELNSIKSSYDVEKINEEISNFILLNNIIEYDNTKGILLGIMFQKALGLKVTELKIENLRKAVMKIDDDYASNGRFDNSIITKLIDIDKNK